MLRDFLLLYTPVVLNCIGVDCSHKLQLSPYCV